MRNLPLHIGPLSCLMFALAICTGCDDDKPASADAAGDLGDMVVVDVEWDLPTDAEADVAVDAEEDAADEPTEDAEPDIAGDMADESAEDTTADAPDDGPIDLQDEGANDDTVDDATSDASEDASEPAACNPDRSGMGTVTCEDCTENDYCDYPDDMCGATAAVPTCELRPQACTLIYQPVCGCDMLVHGNSCAANAAGIDLNALGGCDPPSDMWIPCGARFCFAGFGYCQHITNNSLEAPDDFTCEQYPEACGETPSCDCVVPAMCEGGECAECDDGRIIVTCPPTE